ncbi:MAG: peptidase S10 [Anaerolineae bacterium]|nr:MAG: peptidase S10 [Anaerolineae bacterium]
MSDEEKKDNGKEKDKDKEKKDKPEPKEITSVTQHSITLAGKKLDYTVTAGTMILREEVDKEGEKPKASFFYIAYTKKGEPNAAKRPITFSFNGGPGSSSVWLHLGLLGPKRVEMGDAGSLLPPPTKLVVNKHTLLEETDLVFIDPVSTGYSRAVEGEESRQFHGFDKDLETVGDFIRLYTTRNNRWLSPKFLIGESYGTTRAAGLSGYLQKRHGMYLNGIMLVSAILNFSTARFMPGNDWPYILFLPTYAATAFYHKRLSARLMKDLRKTLAEVEAFAVGEYATLMMKGDDLTAKEQTLLADKLAEYTGLTADYIRSTNFRVDIFRFTKELLRGERKVVGRLDSRFLGVDRDAAGEMWENDPSMMAILGPYTATLYDYVRRELKFEVDLPYEILTGKVWPWSYEKQQNEFLNVAETLREAIAINPHLKVHVSNGYYDFATPYFATDYTFKHMQLEEHLRANISMDFYEAGHMMYVHMPSLAQQKKDLARFIKSALP